MRWARHVARMGDRRVAYSILAGTPEGKRPLRKPMSRRQDNIKMDLQEVGAGGHRLDRSDSEYGHVAASC